MTYLLPFFGELDLKALREYYQMDIPFEDDYIEIDLNFNSADVAEDKLLLIKDFLNSIAGIKMAAQQAIMDNFSAGDEVKKFFNFHIGELSKEDLEELLSGTDKSLSLDQQMLSIIKLIRIGFYPEDDDNFATFDFTMNEDISQYLLVVKMNSSKVVVQIAMES